MSESGDEAELFGWEGFRRTGPGAVGAVWLVLIGAAAYLPAAVGRGGVDEMAEVAVVPLGVLYGFHLQARQGDRRRAKKKRSSPHVQKQEPLDYVAGAMGLMALLVVFVFVAFDAADPSAAQWADDVARWLSHVTPPAIVAVLGIVARRERLLRHWQDPPPPPVWEDRSYRWRRVGARAIDVAVVAGVWLGVLAVPWLRPLHSWGSDGLGDAVICLVLAVVYDCMSVWFGRSIGKLTTGLKVVLSPTARGTRLWWRGVLRATVFYGPVMILTVAILTVDTTDDLSLAFVVVAFIAAMLPLSAIFHNRGQGIYDVAARLHTVRISPQHEG